MDQLVQCPVCTLYLHNGMSLESHLDTHPKDQVIKALCTLSASGGYRSRSHTPAHSERSYRSRSRTPADDVGGKWNASQKSSDHDRYWRRTPCRTPKSATTSTPASSTPRTVNSNGTPASQITMSDNAFENNTINNSQCSTPFTMKSDKTQQTYPHSVSVTDFNQQYGYYPEQHDDREIKFSRSAEYTPIDNSNNIFTYNVPTMSPSLKVQTTLLPTVARRPNNLVKFLPKSNNIVVKANVGGVEYITPGVKPMHVALPTPPTYVQKHLQNNMILSGNIPTNQMLDTKNVAPMLGTNQFGQLSTSQFVPGTTVVTQNSQIIYREMVHNIDGKPFITSMPTVLNSHENSTNVAQAGSMYQNVMVLDQFGNASCMYATPQQIVSKPCNSVYSETVPATTDKCGSNLDGDQNKTLIIEVGPIVSQNINNCNATTNTAPTSQLPLSPSTDPKDSPTFITENNDPMKSDSLSTTKGLKILSNIKVEVPVQHHKNMINTVLDLTGPSDADYPERPISPDKILPDLDDNNSHSTQSMSDDCTQPSASSTDSLVSNTFSVIKNVGNPPSYKEATAKSHAVDSKIETEYSDSCPIPDLICNEKPSISPCSELSECAENSNDRTSIIPVVSQSKQVSNCSSSASTDSVKPQMSPQKLYRNNPLRLNNIYLKKHKKILQIKNSKSFPANETKVDMMEPIPSSSHHKCLRNDDMSTAHHIEKKEDDYVNTETIKNSGHDEFDVDMEEKSMDIEPVAPSIVELSSCGNTTVTSIDIVQVKEEINMSNEDGFSNETQCSNHDLTPIESLRPINVITYGNMSTGDFDDDSNHRELLDLESSSKNKQFVNMMNEHYFGDNIYADYFTPDRVESFDAEREVTVFSKESNKDGMYIWGEPSQRDHGEFVLPNFIHESYKIAESSGADYSGASPCTDVGLPRGSNNELISLEQENEEVDHDSKADVLSEGEPPLNICTDERMPPRGELSGQESNGDTWGGMYPEATSGEPYDLLARESWVSDGSDTDPTEKMDVLQEEARVTPAAGHVPGARGSRLLRHHHNTLASSSPAETTYSRLLSARVIKKEEKVELCTGELLSIDMTKVSLSTTMSMLEVSGSAAGAAAAGAGESASAGAGTGPRRRRRRDYVCPACKVDQGSDAAFHAHLRIHPLECLTCGKCFYRRANLALHLKSHLGIKNYKCEVCEKRFVTRQKLSEHHNVHTGRAPVKCTHCDDTFRRYSNMVQHRDRHHLHKRAAVRDLVCWCGGVFHSQAKLRWHQETHDDKPKSCLYCSDKFVHAASLTRHVRRSHNEYYLSERARTHSVENVPCPVCKQVYLRTNLRAHLATHSGKRPHQCVVCSKAFTTAWNLKLHRWTHAGRGARPHQCPTPGCNAAFVRRADLLAHHHAHRAARPYTCNVCGRRFIRKYNCLRHVREHDQPKRYQCKVLDCGKTFHRSYYLSEHMKVHSGARPFACTVCGKTSASKSNHNKHVRIHHAREPLAPEA